MKRKAIPLLIVLLTLAGCLFQSDETPKLNNPLDPNSDTYIEAAVSELNIESGQKFYTSELTATWKGNAYAAEYQCVLKDSTYSWNSSSWIKLIDLTPGDYLFKVTPRNQAGFTGKSLDCLFTVFESPAVDSLSIENGQVFTSPDIEITWAGNNTATSYLYSLNDEPGEWSDATTASFEGLADSVYTLTITAKNEDFTGTPKTWTFIVDTASELLTISGIVTGTDNVTILLNGDASEARITAENGIFSFKVNQGDTFTLTPQKQGYSFEPESVNIDGITTDITHDFIATLNSYTISGTVAGADNVTVQLTGDTKQSATVNDGFSYSFTVNALSTYVVSVSHLGYRFTPNIKMFPTLLEDATQNFQAVQDTYTISGTVTGADSVTVNLSGDSEDSVVVNDGGSYLFSVTSLGTYTVSVEKEGVSFPISQETFHYLLRDETQDFVASITDVITVSGLISGLDNVTVSLSGDLNGTQIVSDGDSYEFIVDHGGTYTVSVFKEACMFDIYQVTFENVNQSNIQNFSGQLIPEYEKNQFLEYSKTGDSNQIELMLEDMPFIYTVKDYKSITSLHLVARYGYTEMAQLLLDKGADIDAKDYEGQTPLHWAVTNGHTETVQLLLDRGADINAKNSYNWTPLHLAINYSNYNSTEPLQLLLDRGADTEVKESENGGTPLHLAAMYGLTEATQLLLHSGANVNAITEESNNTPLDLAEDNGHTETSEILREAGGKRSSEL